MDLQRCSIFIASNKKNKSLFEKDAIKKDHLSWKMKEVVTCKHFRLAFVFQLFLIKFQDSMKIVSTYESTDFLEKYLFWLFPLYWGYCSSNFNIDRVHS